MAKGGIGRRNVRSSEVGSRAKGGKEGGAWPKAVRKAQCTIQ